VIIRLTSYRMSSSGRVCALERGALLKLLLHAFKFPTTGVNGFLLGVDGPSDGAVNSVPPASSQSPLLIVDAVPVSHSYLTLTPSLEIALAQLQTYCKEQGKGIRVVGYYLCNDRLEDAELGPVGKRIADRIEALTNRSIALCLDGKALRSMIEDTGGNASTAMPMKLLVRDATKGWVTAGASLQCPVAGVVDLLSAYVDEGRHRRLVDFEDYLEDVSGDWLNASLLD
jgi:ER membrane protein complex subunit 8/9